MALASTVLVACSGVKPYSDQGTQNLRVQLVAQESGFWTRRGVFLDIWTGPKGPDMVYLGTVEIDASGKVGLPTGRPLHLALAFEEKAGLGGYSGVTTVEMPMKALRPGEVWGLRVSYTPRRVRARSETSSLAVEAQSESA